MTGDFNRRVGPKSINYGPIFGFLIKRNEIQRNDDHKLTGDYILFTSK